MHEPVTAQWAAIRLRYETTQDPVADICHDAGIDRRQLDQIRKKEHWRRQNPRPFPAGRKGAPRPPEAPPAPGDGEDADAAADAPRPVSLGEAVGGPRPASPLPRRTLSTPAARRRLLDRMVAAISLKLEQLERQMTRSLDTDMADPTTATDHERETRAIGALIDNLEKITEMETGLSPKSAKRGDPTVTTDLAAEAERCRRELADRLSRIVEAAAREA